MDGLCRVLCAVVIGGMKIIAIYYSGGRLKAGTDDITDGETIFLTCSGVGEGQGV